VLKTEREREIEKEEKKGEGVRGTTLNIIIVVADFVVVVTDRTEKKVTALQVPKRCPLVLLVKVVS
jgi:hypothetical protein